MSDEATAPLRSADLYPKVSRVVLKAGGLSTPERVRQQPTLTPDGRLMLPINQGSLRELDGGAVTFTVTLGPEWVDGFGFDRADAPVIR